MATDKELKDIEILESKGVLKSPPLNDLVRLADYWADQWKVQKQIVENLAKDERFGEAEAFNSKAKIYLECAEMLRRELQV